jgi:SnoaL-like protein
MASENEHRFDDTIATFSNPRYELVANGLEYDGEDAVRRYFTTSRGAIRDQRNDPISLRHADDAVIVEFWLLGTLADQDHPGRLTDRQFRARMCAVFEFEGDGDRIVCERVYWDRQTITDQLKGN